MGFSSRSATETQSPLFRGLVFGGSSGLAGELPLVFSDSREKAIRNNKTFWGQELFPNRGAIA